MEVIGLDVFELPNGSPAFYQPCVAYLNQSCSIYSHRPIACQDFECKLLQKLIATEINLPEALDHTCHSRALIEQLRSYMLDADESLPLERQVRYQWFRVAPPSEAVEILEALTQLLLTQFGVRWDRRPGPPK